MNTARVGAVIESLARQLPGRGIAPGKMACVSPFSIIKPTHYNYSRPLKTVTLA